MLSPKVPQGPRNPNGYSEDEILHTLRAIDGTREVSFRYELLDRDLNYKYDLDNILSGSVQMQYISEIKRTASFQMRGGAGINWLDDHIKPYFRMKMPPKMVDDGIPLNNLWSNSFDAASGDVTPQNSGNYGDTVSRVDGSVRYFNNWCALGSDDGSETGSFSFNFRARETWKISFYINIPTGSNLNFFPDGLDVNTENYLRFDDTFGQYNLGSIDTTHIKDNLFGAPVRVDMLNDGYRCRYDLYWTDPGGSTPDFSATEDSSFWEPVQIVSVGGGGFSRNTAFIDEIRVTVPGETELLPRTEPLWSNTFNGISGDFVDSDSLQFYGSPPDETIGDLSFNQSWSIEGDEASLQLGGSAGYGSLQTTVPPREEWSLTMYANIPAGGKLFVCPSPEESVPSPEEAPSWAGPIQEGNISGSSGWNTEIIVPVPEGTEQGDWMICAVTSNDSTEAPTAPEGWELLNSQEFGGDTWMFIYTKEAGPDEPANYGFVFTTEHWHAAFIQTWKNTNGPRFVGINAAEGVSTVSLPSLSAEEGDALAAVGFDWDPCLKTWDDGEVMTTQLHQEQGMVVSTQLNLPSGITPTYALQKDNTDPSRMAAASIIMKRIPNPAEVSGYPGDIQKVGSTFAGGFTDTVNVGLPPNVEEGDYMIATLSANDFNGITAPSGDGWTLVDSMTDADLGSGTGFWVYERVATASEPADYSWTFDGAHWHYGVITAWRNTPGIRYIDLSGGENITSVTTSTFTAFDGDTLLLAGFDWTDNIKSWNDNGELTTDVNIDQSQIVSSLMSLPAGETPSYTLTGSEGDPTRMCAATIVLESYDEPEEGGSPFRGPNWIVLDDVAGEYTIAGVDVSEYLEYVIGVPFRIDMETYGGRFWWQVFATDPLGTSPDMNWYGSSEDWGQVQAFLFQGGGDGTPAPSIDNVSINRIVPVTRPTPEETNYVEFPLGVFLMSSPTRKIDEDDVIIRDVEAYDRTKLFVDDKLTERFTVTKGENYTDIISSLLGDIPKIVEPSDYVCGRDREWSIGTKIKEVIDSIAESINYHTLRFDEEGRAVVQPYVSPADRTPEFNYADDEISIMYPDVEVEFDTFDIANVWITTVSQVDTEPVYVKLENHDPSNPFSIPRRGRKIVDFRQEEEATDHAGLLRKAKRIQYEANREYENISFNTLINPLHEANDCYTIDFQKLGVREKYTEINWEFNLEAGSTMTHTARREVKLDAEDDPGFIQDSLVVNGSLTAGNVAWGKIFVPITRTNKPQVVHVTGLDLQGSGTVEVLVTPETSVPDNFKQATSQNESPNGFEIWGYRTTHVDTLIHWMALRSL
jgi:hypothetical protein